MGDNGEEGEEEGRPDWSELTHVCLVDILERLTLEDRWNNVMFVCKSWLQACKDPSLNSVFNLEPHFKSANDSPRWWTPEFESRIDSMLRSIVQWSDGSLKEIRIRHCSDSSLSLVSQRCSRLEVLSVISSSHVTDESISRIASNCPKLIELDVSFCHEVSHESLAMIGKNCPNFKTLRRNFMNCLDPSLKGIVPSEYLNISPRDGDSEAAAIGKYMPCLLHLEIRFSMLTATGLNLVCQGCPNLEQLDLSGCANVSSTDAENSIINLKKLRIIRKPYFCIPRPAFNMERYGHWSLYAERFQMDNFRI